MTYTDIERKAIAARATYWDNLGDCDRADQDPSPSSLSAWIDVVQAIEASL